MNVKTGVRNIIRSGRSKGLQPLIVAGSMLPGLMMVPMSHAQDSEALDDAHWVTGPHSPAFPFDICRGPRAGRSW
jgi:hypothetical protein